MKHPQIAIVARGAERKGRNPAQGYSAIRGLGNSLPGGALEPRKGSQGPRTALQGPWRGVSVSDGAGKEGGPLRGPVFPDAP